ncbi:MAG: DUF1819 family protein [Alphaproteobacteria bacterium]|nr:DUF1819 family protein [Alphaproteobacteria bacterium]
MTNLKQAKDIYKADMTGGALLFSETRIVSQLLCEGKSFNEIKILVEEDNILQKRGMAAAKRMFMLVKNRLELFDMELWNLIAYGDVSSARLAVYKALGMN